MDDYEVVVLGGGPGGCAAATLLARRAHRVALLCPERPPAAALAESIPPSARKVLSALGLLDAVEAAGFHPNRGNTVRWAGAPARSESFEDDDWGWHVDRAGLEEALLGAAEASGVRVLRGARAREAERRGDRWLVRADGPGDAALQVTSDWVLDATGRRGVLADRSWREPDPRTTTLALVARWSHPDGWPDETGTHTLVESYGNGWAWSVPLSPTERCVTAMVDQRARGLAPGEIREMLVSELAHTEHLWPSLRDAEPVGEPLACPATLYTSSRFAEPGLLLVGDAASFIDPLSSYGVKKALSSGWLAGVAVHTALVDAALEDVALRYYADRERAVYHSFRAASIPFFESAAEHYDDPYWRERAEAARVAASASPESGSPTGADTRRSNEQSDHAAAPDDLEGIDRSAVPEPLVRAAFDRIRERDELAASPAPSVRRLERPVVRGERIVLADHLASEIVPHGLRWVRGIDLAVLLDVAPHHASVPDGWAAYNGKAPPVTLPDYLTALSTAFAAGLLVHREG